MSRTAPGAGPLARFAVSLDVPQPPGPTLLEVDLHIPDETVKALPNVTLTGRVNGQDVFKRKFTGQGSRNISVPVPALLLQKSPAEIDFDLDGSFKDKETGREMGIILFGVRLKHPDGTVESAETDTRNIQESYQRLLRLRRLKMPIEQQTVLMKMFHELDIWKNVWFHGVQIEKNPLDLWMMQQILYEQRPDFVIETGTAWGGSALYWAHILRDLGLTKSRVFTMDVDDHTQKASADPLWKDYVTFYKGSSTDPDIVSKIAGQVRGKKTIVTLDSDHSMQHVMDELKMYAPLVSRGSYLIVEDTNMDGVPTAPGLGPGPMAAVRKFLAEGGRQTFQQDLNREAFVMTFQPGGWLRRK